MKLVEMDKDLVKNYELIVKWYNDPEIKYFITPNRVEADIEDIKLLDFMKSARNVKHKVFYFIEVEGVKIGIITVDFKFPFLAKTTDDTAWISICIGEKDYWGKGYSKEAMKALEKLCFENGYGRIELGVFGFNGKAQKLYEKMGYQVIDINDKFTYYQGEWYQDIRMDKILTEEVVYGS